VTGWKRNREDKNEVRKIIEVGHGFGIFEYTRGKCGSGAHAEDKINIILDGGPLWDPVFGAMNKGGEDATKDLGVDFQWVTSTDSANFDTDYAKLVKQSASRRPSALIIGNYSRMRSTRSRTSPPQANRSSFSTTAALRGKRTARSATSDSTHTLSGKRSLVYRSKPAPSMGFA
jgi:hypothetical protein